LVFDLISPAARRMDCIHPEPSGANVAIFSWVARLVYDRELHDQLLNDVLVSELKQPGLTLTNSLAKQQAEELLASAEEYF